MCTWGLEVLMEWKTKASCSGFQAGVVSKCLGTVQLCSARTSKGHFRLFQQWLPSIYRWSDWQRGTDLRDWLEGLTCVGMESECKGPQCLFRPGNERCANKSSLPVQGHCLHSESGFCQAKVQQKQGRIVFTCFRPVRPPSSAGFDPKTCRTSSR